MQHGWRWQRSTFRCVSQPFATRWAGAGPMHRCFTLWSLKLLSCPRECRMLVGAAALIVAWSLRHGECPRARSEPCQMSPFLDFSRSPSRFLSRSLSLDLATVFIQALCETVVSVPNYTQGASPTTMLVSADAGMGGLNNYQKEQTPHPGPSSKTASCLPFWFLEVAHQVRRTQLCPEMVLPEVEKAAATQARAEGSKPPTPSIGLLPRQ